MVLFVSAQLVLRERAAPLLRLRRARERAQPRRRRGRYEDARRLRRADARELHAARRPSVQRVAPLPGATAGAAGAAVGRRTSAGLPPLLHQRGGHPVAPGRI